MEQTQTLNITAIPPAERNRSMDIIRGVAVLGILLLNIPGFSSHGFFLHWNDAIRGHLTLDGFIYKTMLVVFDGKMRGLFTLLFGAGIMLFMENKKTNSIQVADAYFRRTMWLLLFGFIDSYLLLWRGDILYEYAMCGLFLFAFRNLRARYMILLAIIILSIYTYIPGSQYSERRDNYLIYQQTNDLVKQGKKLTPEQIAARETTEETISYQIPFTPKVAKEIKEDILKDLRAHQVGYIDMLVEQAPDVMDGHTKGFYTDCWESFATILLGMALFKLGFFSYKLKLSTYRWFCFVGIPAGITLMVLSYLFQVKTRAELFEIWEWRWFSVFYLQNPARIILILGYASALMLLCRVNWMKGFLSLFGNVGRMAFTNYIMQTLMCSFYFYGFGLGHYGEYRATGLFIFVMCIWAIQITYCWIYFKFFQIGPLEWLWKKLTYGKAFGKSAAKTIEIS